MSFFVLVGVVGALWDPVGPCGALWGPVGPCEALWRPVGPCGALWGPVGPFGESICKICYDRPIPHSKTLKFAFLGLDPASLLSL